MDKRVIKTKQKLQDALARLTVNKPVDEISISELCKNANTNRNTFYTYYNNTRDLLEDIVSEYENRAIEAINNSFLKKNYDELLIKICNFIKESKSLQLFISNKDFRASYLDEIVKKCSDYAYEMMRHLHPNDNDQQLQRKLRFICGGIMLVLMDWFYAGMQEDPTALIEQIHTLSVSLAENNLHM